MTELFDIYCLQSYPDIDAMDKLAKQRGDAALSAEDFPRPGKVWAVQNAVGRSVISATTGELSGCSVRRMTTHGLPDSRPVVRVMKAWVKVRHLKLQAVTPMVLPDIKVGGYLAVDDAGNKIEIFTFSIMNLLHRQPKRLASPGEDGPGVELYLGCGFSTLPGPKH